MEIQVYIRHNAASLIIQLPFLLLENCFECFYKLIYLFIKLSTEPGIEGCSEPGIKGCIFTFYCPFYFKKLLNLYGFY